MNNSNLTEFKNDFNNLLRCEDIMEKYKISKTTYHTIVRKLGLKRPKTSKLLRTFNMNFTDDNKPKETEKKTKLSHIPIDDVYKKIDETDDRLVYSRQFVSRGTKLDIEKTETTTTKPKPKPVAKKEQVFKEVDENELNAILDKADKTIAKIQNKKQGKNTENKNK
jgi:hypothetical protein